MIKNIYPKLKRLITVILLLSFMSLNVSSLALAQEILIEKKETEIIERNQPVFNIQEVVENTVVDAAANESDQIIEVQESTENSVKAAQPTEVLTQKTPLKFKKDSSKPVEEQLALVRQHILANNLPKTALDRLDQFEVEQKSLVQTGLVKEAPSDAMLNEEPFKVETFEGKIQTKDVSEYEKDFTNANVRRPRGVANQDPSSYLEEGSEIKFSQAIKDQADALLGDPLKILNFVRNDIEYTPYFGSKKGADATLIEKAGNDMDKAALLIAMLRYKNIPARYRHANIKMDVRIVTDLLGVETAEAAGKILALNDIPVTLYTQNNQPLFFVVEHFYVEAYFPYGHTRGADISDGGEAQWVPMDSTINAYYYEQFVDVIGHLKNHGFDSQIFFENYLANFYQQSTPLHAFKQIATTTLTDHPPIYYPNLTYDDALTKKYPKRQNLEFIPGSLPFEIVRDINSYNFIPDELRHKLSINLKDINGVSYFNQEIKISDLANKELYISYIPATTGDRAIIDSFETIYDVVPLSLVKVKPVIKIGSAIIAESGISFDLATKQSYSLEFSRPNGDYIDVQPTITTEILSKPSIIGVTDAIALDVGRVIPKELRPEDEVTNQSRFISDSLLYSAALDFIKKLEDTSEELSLVFGSSIIDTENKASVENAVNINYINNLPYSFDWIGLKIDAVSHYKYFYRFSGDTKKYIEDFTRILGLESSLNESTIFEERFNVSSISTVKGIKLVNSNTFPNTSMLKITNTNESIIDTLQISNTLKANFHDLIAEGNTIYTPTKPITYGIWSGLFYISTNPSGTETSYIIGEGLNGGYTVIEQWPNGWSNFWRTNLLPNLTATIIKPLNNQEFMKGDIINWEAQYSSPIYSWTEKLNIETDEAKIGWNTLQTGYGTNQKVRVRVNNIVIGEEGKNGNNNDTFDQNIIDSVNISNLSTTTPDFRKVLKAIFHQETNSDPYKIRYEPCTDQDYSDSILNEHPFSAWRLPGIKLDGTYLTKGPQVDSLKIFHGYTPEELIQKYTLGKIDLSDSDNDGTLEIYEIWKNNDATQKYTGPSKCGADRISTTTASKPAQLLISSSWGIGQIMYRWFAKEFDPDPFPPALDIWQMFSLRPNIIMAGKVIKGTWGNSSSIQGSECNLNDRLWTAIAKYNSGGFINDQSTKYANSVCRIYKGLINQ